MSDKLKESFQFFSSQNLNYLTGRRAKNLSELLTGIREVEEMSIYYHSHHYLEQHEYLSPEPPNDFFYWITHMLRNKMLGEKVSSIDLRQLNTLKEIQTRIADVIEKALMENEEQLKFNTNPGEDFHFMSVRIFVYPTKHIAHNLVEFRNCLMAVPNNSIYFHIFGNRFSNSISTMPNWLSGSLNEVELARKIERIDPYTLTLGNLRELIVKLVENRIKEHKDASDKGI